MANPVNDSASGGDARDPITVFLGDDHEFFDRAHQSGRGPAQPPRRPELPQRSAGSHTARSAVQIADVTASNRRR
jgi:hypothetical protein